MSIYDFFCEVVTCNFTLKFSHKFQGLIKLKNCKHCKISHGSHKIKTILIAEVHKFNNFEDCGCHFIYKIGPELYKRKRSRNNIENIESMYL